jgi:DNA repair protein RecO (recombination protein O)
MLVKTKGLALSFVKYGDSSIITKVYTEKYGIQSYIVNGVRSKNSKNKISLFQPLTQLDLVVYYKDSGGLQRISELKCHYAYSNLTTVSNKLIVSFFIQEFLSKVLRGEQSNESLFKFITSSLQYFDVMTDGYQNFHLQFILKISDYLGYSISSIENLFNQINKLSYNILEYETIDKLINEPYTNALVLNSLQRREILKDILKYYSLNYEGMSDLHSIEVIRDVLE